MKNEWEKKRRQKVEKEGKRERKRNQRRRKEKNIEEVKGDLSRKPF